MDVRYNLGQAYAMVGDFASAARELGALIVLKPDARDARYYLERYQAQATGSTPFEDDKPLCKL